MMALLPIILLEIFFDEINHSFRFSAAHLFSNKTALANTICTKIRFLSICVLHEKKLFPCNNDSDDEDLSIDIFAASSYAVPILENVKKYENFMIQFLDLIH
jgi:hypothetical protein